MDPQGKKFSFRRFSTLFIVLAVHFGVIFIPLGMMLFMPETPKPVAFRVKLGGDEPSQAPETGPPERRRTTGTAGGGAPPPPPPPVRESSPKTPPEPPPPPEPKSVPKPKPKPKTKPQPDRKQQQQRERQRKQQKERERQRKLRQQRERQRKLQKERERRRKQQQERERQRRLQQQRERRRQQQSQVHHDSRGDSWDPGKPFGGGSNTNRNVPIGSRDVGQVRGPVNGRTPAGGASANEEKYWQRVHEFFSEKWQEPAGVFVTAETAVVIHVEVDAGGRVIRKNIVKFSPNAAVNQSVKVMLNQLDYIPAPPAGVSRSFDLQLVSQ